MKLRYLVVRSAVFLSIILFAVSASFNATAQTESPSSPKKPSSTSSIDRVTSDSSISRQVTEAEAAIGKSDWKTAETKLDAWLATHPNDARALFDAGYVADAEDRVDDAAGLYRRATEADPKSFEAHLSLGLLLARQGKPIDARPELQAATTLDPGEAGAALKARAWRALAEIDKPSPDYVGDTRQASTDLLEALKLSPETPADTLLAASLAESAGQSEEAEAAYRRLLTKDPGSVPANAGLAHVLMTRKEYPEAETLLRAAINKSPDDPTLNAQLATVLAAQDKAEALPLLQKLYGAHPHDTAITRMLADVEAQAGDAAGSDKLYTTLLASQPDDIDLLVAHGQNLIRLLKYPEAQAVFAKATHVDPSDGDAWSGLAFSASKTGQPAVALHALTMRSKFLPEVPSTYFLWATSYDTMHDKTQAIAYYHHFLESAGGKFPDQEWQAKQRLLLLEKKNQ
ncbi:MAG TPA: tetratricopeptide repeat protein [Terracidiphilus sp.]|jgi:predicted Zn-dependent protease|nr:tetratricopeptide repeat protein [Terracidiphilus sp.]